MNELDTPSNDAKDAARYRHLRNQTDPKLWDAYDASIDAAIQSVQLDTPSDKPVAWMREKQGMVTFLEFEPSPEYGSGWVPLYTAPQGDKDEHL